MTGLKTYTFWKLHFYLFLKPAMNVVVHIQRVLQKSAQDLTNDENFKDIR